MVGNCVPNIFILCDCVDDVDGVQTKQNEWKYAKEFIAIFTSKIHSQNYTTMHHHYSFGFSVSSEFFFIVCSVLCKLKNDQNYRHGHFQMHWIEPIQLKLTENEIEQEIEMAIAVRFFPRRIHFSFCKHISSKAGQMRNGNNELKQNSLYALLSAHTTHTYINCVDENF